MHYDEVSDKKKTTLLVVTPSNIYCPVNEQSWGKKGSAYNLRTFGSRTCQLVGGERVYLALNQAW
jgi:hypothetical protein